MKFRGDTGGSHLITLYSSYIFKAVLQVLSYMVSLPCCYLLLQGHIELYAMLHFMQHTLKFLGY